TEQSLPRLPSTIEQLNSILQEKQIIEINIPIRKHYNILAILETLYQHFSFNTTPEYIFDLIDLLEPSFDIFNIQKTTTTNMHIIQTETDPLMDNQ
ncbi:173_t:CDS:1, partial [Scutellospora calospora]